MSDVILSRIEEEVGKEFVQTVPMTSLVEEPNDLLFSISLPRFLSIFSMVGDKKTLGLSLWFIYAGLSEGFMFAR